MTAIKNNWITGLTLVGAGFLVLSGIAMTATGGEFNENGVRILGAFGGLGGLSILAGLWGLRTGRTEVWQANGLIAIGAIVLGVGFWWFVFVPPVMSLVVLYAGVIKQGLVRELRAT